MTTLFLKNAAVLVTLDGDRREIKDGALVVMDNVIQAVGTTHEVEAWLADDPTASPPKRVINAEGTVVLPGLVNCHHHLYQTLTRTVGTSAGMVLFDWLKTLYPIWAEMDGEAVYVSAKVGLSEMVLSGATTVAELAAVGKGAIFIPFPFAADNHQVLNAKTFTEAEAAEMIIQKDLTGHILAKRIKYYASNKKVLEAMATRAKKLGRPDAAEVIVKDCYRLLNA